MVVSKDMFRSLIDMVTHAVAQVQGSFQDVRAPPLTISTLQSLISLPLIRPELFRKGILKKNFIPGVLLFGPPGTGKVFLLCNCRNEKKLNSIQ